MDVFDGLAKFQPPGQGTALTIGNFDGVHRGHRRIVEAVRQAAGPLRAPTVVVTFEPHPLAVLAPQRAPARLTTAAEKNALLAACGVACVIVLRSEPALFTKTAEEFLGEMVRACRPRVIVEGEDFHFGRGREGSVATLREYAVRFGFKVEIVPTLLCASLSGTPAINSSAIRRALREGRIADANQMLGRPYRVVGEVVSGQGRGTPLGFPTANLAFIPHLLPQEAVYAAIAQLSGGGLRLAAVNIGPQPTFAQETPRVEAHLLDFKGDLVGQRMGLHLLARLRGQIKFANVGELSERIRLDIAEVQNYRKELERGEHESGIPL